jgi:hypothetical protein
MRTTSKLLKSLAVLSALLPFCSSGLASIVYDNSLNDLQRIVPGTNGVEYGDEITLSGTDRIVNDFQFEYYLSGNANHNETLQLLLHKNDGPLIPRTLPGGTTVNVASPGTVLYTSPLLSLQTGYQIAEASLFEAVVPDTFTWTVSFGGIDAGEVVGLRVYGDPTIGESFNDFWSKNNGTWNTYLLEGGAVPANFAARVSAIPEPTTLAFALLAGLGWVGYLGFKRRS